jgi:hypothetical protein
LGWVPFIALISGKFFEEIYFWLCKYYKYLGIGIIIIILIFGYLGLREKLNTMYQVKQFSPTFFEACGWIKKNTPKDAVFMSIWSHRAVYSCQRNSIGNTADIALSNDVNYTINIAKELGITHLFIQKFSIDPNNQHLSEKYDLSFVQFLENNSEHFKKIYENGPSLQECLQSGNCDGNIVYEIV